MEKALSLGKSGEIRDNDRFWITAGFCPASVMNQIALYLASASPRRREILGQLGIEHQVLPQDVDESHRQGETPADYVCRLASAKAQAALDSLDGEPHAACLGSDTTVVCDGNIFEKPRDEADARRMLSALSGRTHRVLTAVALATAGSTEVRLSESTVTFREITDVEIGHYWHTGEPADKAGAYGIQGLGAMFVQNIHGSYSGIMGLPVMETMALLATTGMTAEHILEAHRDG